MDILTFVSNLKSEVMPNHMKDCIFESWCANCGNLLEKEDVKITRVHGNFSIVLKIVPCKCGDECMTIEMRELILELEQLNFYFISDNEVDKKTRNRIEEIGKHIKKKNMIEKEDKKDQYFIKQCLMKNRVPRKYWSKDA